MREPYTRRHLLAHSASGFALATLAPRLAFGQETTLEALWMGCPEEQVLPLLAAFEASADGVVVQAQRLPIGELFRALEVQLSARTPEPDVYLVDGPLTASYAVRGHLVEQTAVMEPQYDRFVPAAVDQGLFDGKMFAAPLATSSQLLFCNVGLFEQAGIPLPSQDPAERMTWAETVELAKRLTDAEAGVFGLAFENSARPYQILAVPQSWGAEVIGPDGLTATGYVDGEPFVESMRWYADLFQGSKVSPPGVFDNTVMQEMFGAGKIAMIVAGTWNLGGFQKYADISFATAPHPYFEHGRPVTPTGGWHIGINPRTEHMAVAQAFVDFLMTDEAMNLWLDLRAYPPVLKSVWEQRAATTFADPAWEIVQFELANTAVPRPRTPGYREYEDLLRVAFQDIQTGADVQTTLAAAASNIDREMQKYRT